MCHKIKTLKDQLKSTLSNEHFNLVLRLNNSSYESHFSKHKERLTKKFEKIENKQWKPVPTTNRPSLIKDPVLQLQKDPRPPSAVSLLSLGTKFAVTPREVPKMEIIEEVEKTYLSLERKGKGKEAETLRRIHEVEAGKKDRASFDRDTGKRGEMKQDITVAKRS